MAAVLGAQLAFTMIVASVLSKLSGHYSFGRWILCRSGRLARFIHPSDDDLRRSAGAHAPPKPGSKNRRNNDKKSGDDFTILKSALDLQLDSAPIRPMDLLPLQFYTEFQWLMDFSVCALFIYLVTELYYAVVRPSSETNLSLFWCLLVGGFALKIMYSMTAIYFRVEEGGEKILCVVFAAFFLVAAMAVLIVDERTLDFGLQPAYENFTLAALKFLEEEEDVAGGGASSDGPVSLLTIRIVLAGMCAVVGAFLTFPGLRLARMHTDALRYASERPVRQILHYINIAFPLVISFTWIRPLFRDRLVGNATVSATGDEGDTVAAPVRFVLDDETVQLLRVLLIFAFCLFRFTLIWDHLQAHLNMAIGRVSELKKEAGRISSTELKKHVVRVYYYLCVVALQYLAPLVLLLFCAVLLKTLGDFSVSRALGWEIPSVVRNSSRMHGPRPASPRKGSDADPDSVEGIAENIIGTASQFSQSITRLKLVFTPLCFRGLLSFTVWWICTAWFTTSAFGLMYYSYFKE